MRDWNMRLSTCCDAIPKNPYTELCSWCKEYAEFYEAAGPDESCMRLEALDEDGSLVYKKIEVEPIDLKMVSQKGRDSVKKEN